MHYWPLWGARKWTVCGHRAVYLSVCIASKTLSLTQWPILLDVTGYTFWLNSGFWLNRPALVKKLLKHVYWGFVPKSCLVMKVRCKSILHLENHHRLVLQCNHLTYLWLFKTTPKDVSKLCFTVSPHELVWDSRPFPCRYQRHAMLCGVCSCTHEP